MDVAMLVLTRFNMAPVCGQPKRSDVKSEVQRLFFKC
jgi:hypothetical protein